MPHCVCTGGLWHLWWRDGPGNFPPISGVPAPLSKRWTTRRWRKQDVAWLAPSVLPALSKSNLNAIPATACTSSWISSPESGAGTCWAGAAVLIFHLYYGGLFRVSRCRNVALLIVFYGCG